MGSSIFHPFIMPVRVVLMAGLAEPLGSGSIRSCPLSPHSHEPSKIQGSLRGTVDKACKWGEKSGPHDNAATLGPRRSPIPVDVCFHPGSSRFSLPPSRLAPPFNGFLLFNRQLGHLVLNHAVTLDWRRFHFHETRVVDGNDGSLTAGPSCAHKDCIRGRRLDVATG